MNDEFLLPTGTLLPTGKVRLAILTTWRDGDGSGGEVFPLRSPIFLADTIEPGIEVIELDETGSRTLSG